MTVPAWLRRLSGHCLVLLLALLPALLAGTGVDSPPGPGEWSLLERARGDSPPSLVTAGFVLAHVATAPADLPAPGSAQAAAVLATARLAQVWGLLAISLLTYLALTLSIWRARALLTCAFLCVMPSIVAQGYVLRPETPATLFGLLALVLLLGIPTLQRSASARRSSGLLLAAVGVNAGLCIGFAAAALPSAAIMLLLPGLAMIIVAAQLVLRLLRVLRRRLWVVVPLRAASGRLWPWVFASLAALAAAAMLLDIAVLAPDEIEPTWSDYGLLPASAYLRWPLIVLAVLGAIHLLLRVGLRLGRRGRLGPDGLLLLYCVVMLGQRLRRDSADDDMPAAVSMAVLLAEGLVYAVLMVSARRRR